MDKTMETEYWVPEHVREYLRSLGFVLPLEAMEGYIRMWLAERHLTLNADKTQILEPGEPMELLGIGINGRDFDIAANSMDKIRTKLVHTADKIVRQERRGIISRDEGMRWMIRRTHRYFFGGGANENELNWVDWSFPVLTRAKSLYELDSLVQQLLRYVGSGQRGNARYRVRYDDLKAYGYRSLVHEFYHHRHETSRELVILADREGPCATLAR